VTKANHNSDGGVAFRKGAAKPHEPEPLTGQSEPLPMSRERANDYDEKKEAILDVAAALFSERGYAGCKLEDVAERCGVSKSMLYHYFKKKEDILFTIHQTHVRRLVDLLEAYEIDEKSDNTDEAFLHLVELYLGNSSNARAKHVVALHDIRYLTDKQKRMQVALERELIDVMARILSKLGVDMQEEDYRFYALLLVGMMNWIELWYRRSGRISPKELRGRVSNLFLNGFLTPF
jgi:AcrR family transcriptional regulator